jgi:uncharacterized delta-60 repeat protein
MQRSSFSKTSLVLVALALAAPAFSQTADSFNPSPNDVVYSLAPQPDGKVLLGGNFTSLNGLAHTYFGRVDSGGLLDGTFGANADFIVDGNAVNALALLPDGSIILGGSFGYVNGQTQVRLGRVSADGQVLQPFPWANDGSVQCLALQADGKLLVGGGFDLLGGQLRYRIGRINADSSIDAAFNPGADNPVISIVVQPDGKILVGGSFANLAGTNRACLGRLNSDGSIDGAFNPGADNYVNCLALQADGKILVGGGFTNLAGQARSRIGRLNPDGSLDMTFNPGANDQVTSLAIQCDGAILAGGYFTNLGGLPRNFIGRIATNGTVDATFNPNAGDRIAAVALQADGKVLLGGSFNSLGSSNRPFLGRLNNTAGPTQDLTYKTSKITWQRGGTGPEIWRAAFDYSTDGGNTWTSLATPSRIASGWQLTSVSISSSASIRARGFVSGGQSGGSCWFVETNIGPLSIVQQPVSRTNLPGDPAAFTIRVGGGSPPSFQWRKNGANLANTSNISGVTTPTLAISNAFGLDSGAFTVVINDGHTTLTSQVATLTVPDPLITLQPAGLTNTPFTTASFTVAAIGQAPLAYVWQKNGTPLNDSANISGSHTPTLALTNVLGADAGQYAAVISDASGSVTSLVASLTVLDPLLTSQPLSQTNIAGQSASFSVTALGTSPLYQWLQNGTNLSDGGNVWGSQAATLSLTNVGAFNAGSYQAIVSNAFGSVTSVVATLTVFDPIITSQPAGTNINLGQTANFMFGVAGSAPQFYQWRKNGAPISGANASSLVVTNAQGPDAGYYDVFFTNNYGAVTSILVSLTVNLVTTDSFSTLKGFPYAFAVESDNKIFVVGSFTNVAGFTRINNARLNTDGSFDTTFFASGMDNPIHAVALQTNGYIFYGGQFYLFGGVNRPYLVHIDGGGGIDGGFGTWPNATVRALALQPDGKLLVGGDFTSIGGVARNHLARLNTDNSVDTTFDPGANNNVTALALQPDGEILVGGAFTTIAGASITNLARLNPDGTIDPAFNPPPAGAPNALLVQPDGRIIVGSDHFSTPGGVLLCQRLNANGSPDASFNPVITHSLYPGVYSMALQADGGILVGGIFDAINGVPCSNFGRLKPDGTLDLNFNPGTGWVYATALQPDGKILYGGAFPAQDYGRLNNTGAATGNLSFDSSSITWLRGGTAPEVWRASFEYTTNGINWVGLGDATRISGGWQSTGLPLPTDPTVIRARGFVVGGNWFEEKLAGAPIFASQPSGGINNALGTRVFSASVVGGLPLSYQWLKNGAVLNPTNGYGAQTASLTLTNLLGSDAGQYQLVVSNSFGSITSIVATLVVRDPFLVTQPHSIATNAGITTNFSVVVTGSAPMTYLWFRNGAPLPAPNAATLSLTNIQASDAGSYFALITNQYGSVTSSVVTLSVNMAMPDSFKPAAGTPTAIVVQPDRRIVLGPNSPATAQIFSRSPIRLNADGSTDPGFSAALSNSTVNCLIAQPDGKIVVSGTTRSGPYLWRLNNDGSMDGAFTNNAGTLLSAAPTGLALQPDGKILAGGLFTIGKPSIWTNLARFNSDGTLDSNFLAGANGRIFTVAVQPDGGILVGGSFTVLNGQSHSHIGRLYSDGTLDTNFNASIGVGGQGLNCILLQPDGKILVGGSFEYLNGQVAREIGRFNADGTLDTNFVASPNNFVNSLALDTDGKILLAGEFTTVNGAPRSGVARVNSDGSLDPYFFPAAPGNVYALAMQSDGAILVAGNFSSLAGQARTNIGRLTNPDAATQSLAFDGSTVTWLRGGSSPEVWRSTFEHSTNGLDWILLGAGQRISGGWQLPGLSLPNYRSIRARGFLSSAQYNGSAAFVESIIGAPVVVTSPANRTNNAGTVATFKILAAGDPVLAYRWFKGSTILSDGANISGSSTAILTIGNVLGPDAGQYYVQVSNGSGSITSAVATLSVIEPIISLQPTNQIGNAGQSASFTVAAFGTAPFTYQWRKNGTKISAPNSSTLTLTNLSRADLGAYSVLISTPYGSAISSNATLTINLAMPDSLLASSSDQVRAIAVQTDGKILVGGSFTNLAGQARNYIGRFNPDGSLDPAFNPGADNIVNCFTVQTDGNILVGGYFQNLAGQPRTCIARLYSDGSLDTNFTPNVSYGGTPFVNALIVQPDGKIIVGGLIWQLNGTLLPNIGRLNPDGSLDPNFNSGINSQGVLSVALQTDGKILVGGLFCNSWCYLDRLNTNGALDLNFNLTPNAVINAIVVQPDGKILLGGGFTSLAGTTRNYIARLNTNNSLDTFNPGANGFINTLALQADGKILVGGSFTTLGGQARTNLGRLNPDGTIDTTFFPSANSNVQAIALQPDGSVLVGGLFTNISGQARSGFARLTASDLAGQYLSSDGQTITWLRTGTTPEVWGANFDSSTDGSNWISAGAASRIPGGWRLNGVSLARGTSIRARGYTSGGYYSSSTFLVESISQVLAPPSILSTGGGLGFLSNAFTFNTRAVPGQIVVIEATTDWQTWVPIQTNLVSSGNGSVASANSVLFTFTDPQSYLYSQRFYRIRLYPGIPPPAISEGANLGFQSNRFGFNLAALQGEVVVIEASTNLLNWSAISTNTLNSSTIYFSDPASTNFSRRFYRLRMQ